MPKVTLYVREAEQDLWERAKALAGGEESLSSIVTEALREYVKRKEREREAQSKLQDAMSEVVLQVAYVTGDGPRGSYKIRFVGVKLAEGEDPDTGDTFEIYMTRSGRFVLYGYHAGGDFFYHNVYNSFEELSKRSGVPADVLADAAEAIGKEYVVDIE